MVHISKQIADLIQTESQKKSQNANKAPRNRSNSCSFSDQKREANDLTPAENRANCYGLKMSLGSKDKKGVETSKESRRILSILRLLKSDKKKEPGLDQLPSQHTDTQNQSSNYNNASDNASGTNLGITQKGEQSTPSDPNRTPQLSSGTNPIETISKGFRQRLHLPNTFDSKRDKSVKKTSFQYRKNEFDAKVVCSSVR